MKKWLPILLILWLAFGLRLFQLTAVPPGLTHDEANHGREAIGILDGVWLYYFPLNYGSEPLYSYTVAGSMSLLGENLFALRIVNVIFNLLTIAATYAWAKQAFDERVGLVSAVLLAISFWSLASSHEALRAGMLPFFMVLAVWVFWQMAERRGSGGGEEQESRKKNRLPITDYRILITLFALLIAITFHIYLAARIVWLIFPSFVIYLAIVNRAKFRQVWWPTLLGLLLAAMLVTPMFLYLQSHPQAQTRLGMFRDPLGQVVSGDIGPILQRAGKAFMAFFWPGAGDQFLAYNIPGRPAFDPITGLFFLIGLAITLRFTFFPSAPLPPRSPAPYTFLLLWFLIGIIPSLITGPTANTTRNLAALSAVHILPAVGFVAVINQVKVRWLVWSGTAVWLTFILFTTSRDYFERWGQSPEVRSAYQHTLIEELAYLKEKSPDGTVVISTVYPGPAHDSSIGMVMAPEWDKRWIDARLGLIVPDGRSPQFIIPQSTPPPSPFHPMAASHRQRDTASRRSRLQFHNLQLGDGRIAKLA
jgi:4-amino-4-deoxy-L-arabinose transferase-like glycosyltransferase